ncbi:class I SAM-dependent methyltransferase [Dactylosporangium sp. NPDC000244]|uniref:class I SAM-dependent methyltransferase n=1 Tax=Dactylosporangium sp. NPDC000244 TaxID=3154365 RepID=UPI00332AF506
MVDDNYANAFRNAGSVDKYEHVTYAPGSYASRVNRRQRAFLRGLIRRMFPDARLTQHDFACGTGRAIRNLHGLVRRAHGYDTSPQMLAKAAELGTDAGLHVVATGGPVPEPAASDGPALVTMFRLLLNVDDDVRERALAFAAAALPSAGSGLLIVENHGNRRSLRHLRARRHRGRRWFAELSHAQVEGAAAPARVHDRGAARVLDADARLVRAAPAAPGRRAAGRPRLPPARQRGVGRERGLRRAAHPVTRMTNFHSYTM